MLGALPDTIKIPVGRLRMFYTTEPALFGFLYANHIRPPNKKKNWPKSFPKDYLWTLDKGVLYGHSERSGVLYGNHIYIVGRINTKQGEYYAVSRFRQVS